MILSIPKRALLYGALLWEAIFLLLSAAHVNDFQILNGIGFISLMFLPGILTIVLLRLRDMPVWAYLGLAVGFSIAELMLVTLVGNTLLPYIGIVHPLAQQALLLEFALLINALVALVWAYMDEVQIILESRFIFSTVRDLFYACAPVLFVAMSVAGAFRLNNGADGTLTFIMLIDIALYLALLIYWSESFGENVIPTALFFISLSLLLMTSLRGWYITGHDIQREYAVFQLTKQAGIWSIANYRDAYNACISITILPTIFSNLLSLADPYVFKVLFQILFAMVPSLLYIMVRRYASAAIACISIIYFIAFPTFFTDMPFLGRQEIAFLFLALMVYVLFCDALPLSIRRPLFIFFGIGMVLSHYTTTYTVLASLLVVVCFRPIVRLLGGWLARKKMFADSSLAALTAPPKERYTITLGMVALLIVATFLWSSILTNTASGSLLRVASETFAVISHNTKEDAQSGDVSYSILSFTGVNLSALLTQYENNVVASARADSPGAYYSATSYSAYPIAVAPGDSLPLTTLGSFLEAHGVNIAALNYFFRQTSAKILQVFIIVGFISVLFVRGFVKRSIDTEYLLLAVAGILFMASQVLLPVLSVEYGLLRAFQQSLMFLSLFLVIGSLTLMMWSSARIQLFFAAAIAIVFFISSTGVLTQSLGAYDPQLHLNNDGSYYDMYYLHGTEIAGITWLQKNAPASADIQTELENGLNMVGTTTSIIDSNDLNDIFPGLIRTDSYVLIGYSVVHKSEATVNYNGTLITYTYPVQFLDDNKDLLYDNGDVKIYR